MKRRKEDRRDTDGHASPVPWQLALGVEDEDEAWNMAAACLSAKIKVFFFFQCRVDKLPASWWCFLRNCV